MWTREPLIRPPNIGMSISPATVFRAQLSTVLRDFIPIALAAMLGVQTFSPRTSSLQGGYLASILRYSSFRIFILPCGSKSLSGGVTHFLCRHKLIRDFYAAQEVGGKLKWSSNRAASPPVHEAVMAYSWMQVNQLFMTCDFQNFCTPAAACVIYRSTSTDDESFLVFGQCGHCANSVPSGCDIGVLFTVKCVHPSG